MNKPLLLRIKSICAAIACVTVSGMSAFAWDYEAHRVINQIALASLPTNFPAFVQHADVQERIAFLAGEPDRWRNTTDLHLRHVNGPDHYIDLEELEYYKLKPESLDSLRYEYIGKLAVARATSTITFPDYDASKDQDKVKLLVGLLPWSITENYSKAKSGFSYLKTFEEFGGTAAEISNAQQNLAYVMGIMGHYVGDASQPLHETKHYNGWVGENPNGYTTNKSFHSWIDGGYLGRVGLDLNELKKRVRPAKSIWPEEGKRRKPLFDVVANYLVEQGKQVEPLYKMEKEGQLSAKGEKGLEGKEFLYKQLLVGGQMLGDLWFTAWQQAPVDGYLKTQLGKRSKDAK